MAVITKVMSNEVVMVHRKKRVAAYCRVSTDSDKQLMSLATQKLHYEDIIRANPEWEFAGLYYDEGISGTKKEIRPALMQMITDCKKGKIDYIMTKSISRFARNTTDCLELVRELIDIGIPIYFEKENLDTGAMEGELMLSIMSGLAEDESVSISQNNKWSVRHRFENGTYKIGYSPFGYSVNDGVLSIKEDEAEWVRFIFSEALSGKSSSKIASELNELGVPTKRNSCWTTTTVLGMLTNEKYIGDCLFQKTYTDFSFKRHSNHGEADQFYIEDHHDVIISREDFKAVAQLIEQHAKEKNIQKGTDKYQKQYAFSGRIVCGECGSTFKRRINNTGKRTYPVWVCSEHISNIKNCSMKYIHEEALERTFATMMNKLIFARKEVLTELRNSIARYSGKDAVSEISEIDSLLRYNQDQRQSLVEITTAGYVDPSMNLRISKALDAEDYELQQRKEILVKRINEDIDRAESLRELIEFANKDEMLLKFDGELCKNFVEQITIHSRNELTFHLKCGLNLRERIK